MSFPFCFIFFIVRVLSRDFFSFLASSNSLSLIKGREQISKCFSANKGAFDSAHRIEKMCN